MRTYDEQHAHENARIQEAIDALTPEQLRQLVRVAADTLEQYEQASGSASTWSAFRDSMRRLWQAFRQHQIPMPVSTRLDWRGSILDELNGAGFYFHVDEQVFRLMQPGDDQWHPSGPTLAEAAGYWTGDHAELDGLQDEWGAWSSATFPHQTKASILAHLRREIDELEAAETPAEHCEEIADVQGLLFSLAHLLTVDLRGEARRKLEINRGRTWGEPNAEGFCEHVKTDEVRP